MLKTIIDMQMYKKTMYRKGVPLGCRKKGFREVTDDLRLIIDECLNEFGYDQTLLILENKLDNWK